MLGRALLVFDLGALAAGYRLAAEMEDFGLEASIDTSAHTGAATIRTVDGDVCALVGSDTTR